MSYSGRFDYNIEQLCKKVYKKIGWICRTFYCRDLKFMRQMYIAVVRPHIDYCSTVWSPGLCNGDLTKLQRIQNRAMRTILECHPRTHITDMLDTLKWMSIKQRFYHNNCVFIWKILNRHRNLRVPTTSWIWEKSWIMESNFSWISGDLYPT